MARIAFCIAALATLVFSARFLVTEMRSPGLSFAAPLVGMPLLVTIFGLAEIRGDGITKDGKGAGWVTIVIAVLGVAYIALFFGSWLNTAIVWLALQIPMVIAIVASSTSEEP